MKSFLKHLACELSGHRLGRTVLHVLTVEGEMVQRVRECRHGRYWARSGPTDLTKTDVLLVGESPLRVRVPRPSVTGDSTALLDAAHAKAREVGGEVWLGDGFLDLWQVGERVRRVGRV
jgi:hypothetical protein